MSPDHLRIRNPEDRAAHQGQVVEQVVRPTGLVDPVCEVRPAISQVDDVLGELKATIDRGDRALVTTLTKRMAEDLTEYLGEHGLKVRYLHSDIDTVERVELFGICAPGCSMCWWASTAAGGRYARGGPGGHPRCRQGELPAGERSLIQTIGRAANVNGQAVLYADQITESMKKALGNGAPPREAAGLQ